MVIQMRSVSPLAVPVGSHRDTTFALTAVAADGQPTDAQKANPDNDDAVGWGEVPKFSMSA